MWVCDASKVVDAEGQTGNDATADPDSFITQKLKSLPPQYDSSSLVVEQRMATSRDGTQIPYFIVMPRDLVLDGSNPTLLYGYGGFGVSLGPHYIATSGLAWLERGNSCVRVEANIRGVVNLDPVGIKLPWKRSATKPTKTLLRSRKNLYTPDTGGAGWIECECDNNRNNRHLIQRMDGSGTTVPFWILDSRLWTNGFGFWLFLGTG